MHADSRRAILASLALLAALDAHLLRAQTRQLVPDGSYPEAFSYVSNVRELSDGRVMVADPLGQALVIVDLVTGKADTIGRVGGGPTEYRQPDAVFPLPCDSSLLVDLGNARLTVIAPDGTFGQTYSATQGAGQGLVLVLPRGVDAEGNLYFLHEAFGQGGPPDSATVMRFDRRTGSTESVARVRLPVVDQVGVGGGRLMQMRPLSPRDDWAVAADGRVAVVRAADYSVAWIQPNGREVTGPANDFRPVRVGEAEREAWSSVMIRSGVTVGMRMSPGGERSVSLSRGGGAGPPPVASVAWPEVAPAFWYGRSVVTPAGELWVERYVRVGDQPLLDVFDGAGRKRGELRLLVGRQVVGFGDGTVYLARIDEDDLCWLERYRLQ